MKLESVRELKAGLQQSMLTPLAAGNERSRSAVSLSARPLRNTPASMRSFALGVGRRTKKEFCLAVRLQNRSVQESAVVEMITKRAKGEVDVRYIGPVRSLATRWERRRHRPLRIGVSIGHHGITAGTLGCFVRGREDGTKYVLSNNHVLADENRGHPGDAILQPGAYDGGAPPADIVGQLARFITLRSDAINHVDAAVASLADNIEGKVGEIRGLGRLKGLAESVDIGDVVYKVGRTTGKREGRISAIEVDNVVVSFDSFTIRFDNQIEVEGVDGRAFSDGGDSGSLIVNSNRHAVALLFAGSDQGGAGGAGLTFGNPIGEVLDSLNVELLY